MGRRLGVPERLLTSGRWQAVRSRSQPTKGDIQMARDSDEFAIERYRYLLRTAPPEEIERCLLYTSDAADE